MSIAIYRNLKLLVAVPLQIRPTVANFYPRRMRELRMDWDVNKNTVVTLDFTRIERRLGLVVTHDEMWEFSQGIFAIVRLVRRNGNIIQQCGQKVPRAFHVAWTENGVIRPVYEQIEKEISSRIIIERYLHKNTPDAFQYRIVEIDFAPQATIMGRPKSNSYTVRPLDEVNAAALSDHSDTSEKWAQLFLD